MARHSRRHSAEEELPPAPITRQTLRHDAYARLIRLPMAFHTRRRVGELSSRIGADLTQIAGTLIWTVPRCLRQTVVLVGGVALISLTSGRLTLLMLGTFPLLIGTA